MGADPHGPQSRRHQVLKHSHLPPPSPTTQSDQDPQATLSAATWTSGLWSLNVPHQYTLGCACAHTRVLLHHAHVCPHTPSVSCLEDHGGGVQMHEARKPRATDGLAWPGAGPLWGAAFDQVGREAPSWGHSMGCLRMGVCATGTGNAKPGVWEGPPGGQETVGLCSAEQRTDPTKQVRADAPLLPPQAKLGLRGAHASRRRSSPTPGLQGRRGCLPGQSRRARGQLS